MPRRLCWLGLIAVAPACEGERGGEVACTSGIIVHNTSEGEDMTPGQACNVCHAVTNAAAGEPEAPIYAFAGTVYPTAHEPDDCFGSAAQGAIVEVLTFTGLRHTATVNRAGNFMFETPHFAVPYTARVLFQGRVRYMIEPQTEGDCNSCHTAEGTEGTTGRIRLP